MRNYTDHDYKIARDLYYRGHWGEDGVIEAIADALAAARTDAHMRGFTVGQESARHDEHGWQVTG